mgnify:CR=1 FL=1
MDNKKLADLLFGHIETTCDDIIAIKERNATIKQIKDGLNFCFFFNPSNSIFLLFIICRL